MRTILIVPIACAIASVITLIVSNKCMKGRLKESEAEMWDEFRKRHAE